MAAVEGNSDKEKQNIQHLKEIDDRFSKEMNAFMDRPAVVPVITRQLDHMLKALDVSIDAGARKKSFTIKSDPSQTLFVPNNTNFGLYLALSERINQLQSNSKTVKLGNQYTEKVRQRVENFGQLIDTDQTTK